MKRAEMDPETLYYARLKGRLKNRLHRARHPEASRAYHRAWMQKRRAANRKPRTFKTPEPRRLYNREWMRRRRATLTPEAG